MTFFNSLADITPEVVKASKISPVSIYGIFQRIDTNEYYFSCSSNDIRVCDNWLADYQNGQLMSYVGK